MTTPNRAEVPMTQSEMDALFEVAAPAEPEEVQQVAAMEVEPKQLVVGDEIRQRYDALPWQSRVHTSLEEYAEIHSH